MSESSEKQEISKVTYNNQQHHDKYSIFNEDNSFPLNSDKLHNHNQFLKENKQKCETLTTNEKVKHIGLKKNKY